MVTTVHCRHCGADASASGRYCPACGYALTLSGEQAIDRLLTRLRDVTVGEYDIVRQLGRGGMAAVYLAWDIDLTRYVAIKVMFPELELQDGMAQRFLREARLAASLDDHPHVVRVYRARDVGGIRYFAMKYIDGCSLDQLLRAVGPLPIGITCHVLDQVARALQYAHARGIVHRDVKPSNVMLDRYGAAIVTDFGIARAAEGEHLTRTGFTIGTPAYMSPEQLRGDEFSHAADQYALGAVAYQMLSGRLPHEGTPFEMQEGHIRHAPQPLRELRPDCPPLLAAAVHRMLAKRAEDRWPSLDALSQQLLDVADAPPSQLATELSALVPVGMPPDDGESATPLSPVVPARVVTPTSEASAPAAALAPVVEADRTVVASAVPSLADTDFASYTPRVTPPAPAPVVDGTPTASSRRVPTDRHEAFTVPAGDPRRRRWIVGAVVAIAAVTVAVLARHPAPDAPARTVEARADSTVSGTSAGEPGPAARDTTKPTTDSILAGAAPSASVVDSARPDTAIGPPSRIDVTPNFAPGTRQVAVGDSVPVVAMVYDAAGRRVRSAPVTWSPRDTSGLAWHDHGARRYAVARTPGGRLTVIARSGDARQSVTITAAPARVASTGDTHAASPTPSETAALSATPSIAELSAALEAFQGTLKSGRIEPLEPAYGDSTSADDFLRWLGKTKGLHVDHIESLRNVASVGHGEAVADYAVRLSWRSKLIARGSSKEPAKFRLTFAHENGAWRHVRTQLLERFANR